MKRSSLVRFLQRTWLLWVLEVLQPLSTLTFAAELAEPQPAHRELSASDLKEFLDPLFQNQPIRLKIAGAVSLLL